MPPLMASSLSAQAASLNCQPNYPVQIKHVAGLVDGQLTDVTTLYFTDKIMITITQAGRLSQWIQVPLGSTSPGRAEHYLPPNEDDSLLPMSHLTATTLLGASTADRETIGQLYAIQIATAIATKNPEESRSVLVGIGLTEFTASRKRFFDLIDLATQSRVYECIRALLDVSSENDRCDVARSDGQPKKAIAR